MNEREVDKNKWLMENCTGRVAMRTGQKQQTKQQNTAHRAMTGSTEQGAQGRENRAGKTGQGIIAAGIIEHGT